MKIGIIAKFDPLKGGGVETVVKHTIDTLKTIAGVKIICYHMDKENKSNIIDNVTYKGIKTLNFPILNVVSYNLKIALLLRKKDFNYIISHGEVGAFLKRKNIKSCIRYHVYHGISELALRPYIKLNNGFQRIIFKIYKKIAVKLEKCPIEHSDKIFSVSKHLRAELIKYYNVNPNKVLNISNGVDTNYFSKKNRSSCQKQLGLNPENKYILFIGNDELRKGFDIALRVLKALRKKQSNIFLIALGPKPRPCTGVIYLENKNVKDKVVLINACDILIHPSRYEGGRPTFVIMEAMSCGVPVVFSSSSSPEEIVGSENFQINSEDPRLYAKKILDLIQNEQEYEIASNSVRKSILKKYSLKTYNEYLSFFTD